MRAGVDRVTVYRHFPDARTLLEACSAHARRLSPPPDLNRRRAIDDRTAAALMVHLARAVSGGERGATA